MVKAIKPYETNNLQAVIQYNPSGSGRPMPNTIENQMRGPMLGTCGRVSWIGVVCLITIVLMAACNAGGAEPSEGSSEESNAATLLSGLPADSAQFAFAEVDLILQRPCMGEEVEYSFDELRKRSRGLIDTDFLVDAAIKSIAAGINDENESATILLGNFNGFLEALRESHSLVDDRGRFDPPGTIDPHRGLELFVFPYYWDLYVALPDSDTLLLADSPELLRELIDRHIDGGELNEHLAGLFTHVERVDFLFARTWDATDASPNEGSSRTPPNIYAHAGFLNEDETSTVYAYAEHTEEAIAKEFFDRQSKEPNLSNMFFGYKSDTVIPVGELWKDGRAIIAKAVVPDKDVSDLFLTN